MNLCRLPHWGLVENKGLHYIGIISPYSLLTVSLRNCANAFRGFLGDFQIVRAASSHVSQYGVGLCVCEREMGRSDGEWVSPCFVDDILGSKMKTRLMV